LRVLVSSERAEADIDPPSTLDLLKISDESACLYTFVIIPFNP